ncbi:hypothetical protein D3C76_1540540 [compost metagenome]
MVPDRMAVQVEVNKVVAMEEEVLLVGVPAEAMAVEVLRVVAAVLRSHPKSSTPNLHSKCSAD